MLLQSKLAKVLDRIALVSLNGPWTRIVRFRHLSDPRHRNPFFASGVGINGARFTPKGGPDSLYFAYDPVTALYETKMLMNPYAGVTLQYPPATMFAIEAIVSDVLDLTDPVTVRKVATNISELTGSWELQQADYERGTADLPPTQLLGKTAFESGRIAGIRYFSEPNVDPQDPTKTGVNIMVFPDRLGINPGNRLTIIDPDLNLTGSLP